MPLTRLASAVVCLASLGVLAKPAGATLVPDEILLVVNKNSPESMRLADHYAAARHVPAEQRVVLDVPATEEMGFDDYEQNVVPPIRAFLDEHHLRAKVKCLLTFYGVPFRVANADAAAVKPEIDALKDQQRQLVTAAVAQVQELEQLAAGLDPAFKPGAGETAAQLSGRIAAALAASGKALARSADHADRDEKFRDVLKLLEKLGGPLEIDARVGARQAADASLPPDQRQKWILAHEQADATRAQLAALFARRFDPASRASLRALAALKLGTLGAAGVFQQQIAYLEPDRSASATDSELALLWWDYYPRTAWQPNPLKYDFPPAARVPQTLMVMRLDGPDEARVREMIDTSVRVEAAGLRGIVACDAGHKGDAAHPDNPYAAYDRHIENLARLVSTDSTLKAHLDEREEVFAPHSVRDVALYTGWYSLRNYVPGCVFDDGAIGYHTASFEMLALHPRGERGWVRGLLNDGCVATIGPVQEPYLQAFPLPDEFFPLVMTGKLTLAEAYWATTPMTSWMMCAIGDPLYRPYASNPALTADKLPGTLRAALARGGDGTAASRPAAPSAAGVTGPAPSR